MRDLVINNQHIEPGENTIIKLSVGKLPSGNRIYLHLHVFRSLLDGPTILVLAGVHGDEINGVEIVRRAIADDLFEHIQVGSIIAIPILNIYGFINFSREVPDGKDVNRSFPGNSRGSLAARVAKTLTKRVLPVVDFGLDFHTGGASRYNFPQIRYTKNDQGSYKLAKAFAPPFLLEKAMIPKSLRRTARDLSIPIIVYEAGESLRLDGLSIEIGLNGLKRCFFNLGMIEENPPIPYPVFDIKKSRWTRASHSGIFSSRKRSGQPIIKGEPIGEICSPFTKTKSVITAKRDGLIIGHTNSPVVNQGDALFHIGYDYEQIEP